MRVRRKRLSGLVVGGFGGIGVVRGRVGVGGRVGGRVVRL